MEIKKISENTIEIKSEPSSRIEDVNSLSIRRRNAVNLINSIQIQIDEIDMLLGNINTLTVNDSVVVDPVVIAPSEVIFP